MNVVYGRTLTEAYHKALLYLDCNGAYVDCYDYKMMCLETPLTIHIEYAYSEPKISRLFPGGFHELRQYELEVCDGILDFMVGADENVWEYTYHQRFKDQIPFVIEELRRNPTSRRAVISIRDNDIDSKTDHPACLQNMQFMIRNNRLNLSVLMRSNDAVKACFMNMFAFTQLQQMIANSLRVDVGEYTHIVNSFHAYARDWKTLESYVRRIESGEPTTYSYKKEWKPLMEAETPSIMAMVEEQRQKYIKGDVPIL